MEYAMLGSAANAATRTDRRQFIGRRFKSEVQQGSIGGMAE
jgi:hypothetical protein